MLTGGLLQPIIEAVECLQIRFLQFLQAARGLSKPGIKVQETIQVSNPGGPGLVRRGAKNWDLRREV